MTPTPTPTPQQHCPARRPWPCDTCAKREPGEPVAQWLCKPAPIVIQPNGEVVCHEWKPEG